MQRCAQVVRSHASAQEADTAYKAAHESRWLQSQPSHTGMQADVTMTRSGLLSAATPAATPAEVSMTRTCCSTKSYQAAGCCRAMEAASKPQQVAALIAARAAAAQTDLQSVTAGLAEAQAQCRYHIPAHDSGSKQAHQHSDRSPGTASAPAHAVAVT